MSRIRSILTVISCFTALTLCALIYIPCLTVFGPVRTVRLRQWYGKLLIYSTGRPLKIFGDRPDKDLTCIYLANHQSMFDALIVAAAIPGNFSVIAKKGLLKMPVFSSVVKRMGFIFIDRGNHSEAGASIMQSADKIREGTSMMIFPEGKRSKDGKIDSFKPGAFLLAKRTKVPIIPMGISGSFEANPCGLQFRSGKLRISFGQPILPEDYSSLSIDQLINIVHSRINELSQS